jgi:sulfite reductase beta subunit-like hemoprotein
MRALADAGLTTRRSVRQLGAQHHRVPVRRRRRRRAVRRHAVRRGADALLLRHPLSSTLPRKFKIAFEGCSEDHAYTAINDLGFRAVLRPARRARLPRDAGGGTAILTRSAGCCTSSCRRPSCCASPRRCLRVFKRFGDYEHKQRNRMKFMIRELGWSRWREEYGPRADGLPPAAGGANARDRSAGERPQPTG